MFSWIHTYSSLVFLHCPGRGTLGVAAALPSYVPTDHTPPSARPGGSAASPGHPGHAPSGHVPHWCRPSWPRLSWSPVPALASSAPVASLPSWPSQHRSHWRRPSRLLTPAVPGTPLPAPFLVTAAGPWPSRPRPSRRRPGAAATPPSPPSARPGCRAARSQPSRPCPSLHRSGPSQLRLSQPQRRQSSRRRSHRLVVPPPVAALSAVLRCTHFRVDTNIKDCATQCARSLSGRLVSHFDGRCLDWGHVMADKLRCRHGNGGRCHRVPVLKTCYLNATTPKLISLK